MMREKQEQKNDTNIFKEQIIEMLEKTEDPKLIEFLYGLLIAFKDRWGI